MKVPNPHSDAPIVDVSLSRLQNEGSQPTDADIKEAYKSIKATE